MIAFKSMTYLIICSVLFLSFGLSSDVLGQEMEIQKPNGDWNEMIVEDVDINGLGQAFGWDLSNPYLQYKSTIGNAQRVAFKLGRPDINHDGQNDIVLFIESQNDCGQMGCTVRIYLAPFSQDINPFDYYDPRAVLNFLALDIEIEKTFSKKPSNIILYDGSSHSFNLFRWDQRENSYSLQK